RQQRFSPGTRRGGQGESSRGFAFPIGETARLTQTGRDGQGGPRHRATRCGGRDLPGGVVANGEGRRQDLIPTPPLRATPGVIARVIMFLLGFMASARASDLAQDEQFVFFPTLGWRVTNGWEAEIHGWVFEPERRPIMQAVFRAAVGLDEGEWRESEKTI